MSGNITGVADATQAASPTLSPDSELRSDTVEIPVKLCNLPPMNAIANQLIALSADPDVDLMQIATVMERDPAFAADLLFLANSSLFGFRARIQVVRHAVTVLGLERIKALAMTVAMRSFLTKGGPLLPKCWRHSAACAIVAEQIAPVFDVKGDVAYTLGLLHDIGRLGLLKSYTEDYSPLLNNTFHNEQEVMAAERALLRVDHGVAGAWMVKTWDFPALFAQTCEHHHDPIAPEDSGLLQAIKVACRLADAMGYTAINYENSAGYEEVIRSLPPHIPKKRLPSEAGLRADVESRLKSFG